MDALSDDLEASDEGHGQDDVLMPACRADAADDRDDDVDEVDDTGPCSPSMNGLQDQMAMMDDATAMGQAFDASKNDDSFYPPRSLSATGRTWEDVSSTDLPRLIIPGRPSHHPKASHTKTKRPEPPGGQPGWEAQGAPENAGMATRRGGGANHGRIAAKMDLNTPGDHRSVVAAAVIAGTVLSPVRRSGLSVLLWQHIVSHSHWLVIAMAVIILAVGSTTTCCWWPGLLRRSTLAHTGSSSVDEGLVPVVTGRAGVRVHHGFDGDQPAEGRRSVGTTIALGPLSDTLVVRSVHDLRPSLH